MKLFEKTLTSETKFEGRIIKVLRDTVELENGKTSAREVVCHNGGVCVAALTEQNEVLLVRQFRYPYKEVLLELPAISAETVGYLIYFFWRACACSGYLLSVNPFNQPGVESYKKNMFALLGKPGYEDQKEALEKRISK